MTPNEATIAGAVAGGLLGAITSIFTTRYIVKHGPDYGAKIDAVNSTLDQRIGQVSSSLSARIVDVNETLTQLTVAGTEHFAQQASFQRAQVDRHNASLWKPEARIDVAVDATSVSNSLILKSGEQFTLLNVYIQSKSGATLAEIQIDKGQTNTGFRVRVSAAEILKVKQSANVGGLQNGAQGQLTYRVSKAGQTYEFPIPFTTEDVMVNSTIFTKLLG